MSVVGDRTPIGDLRDGSPGHLVDALVAAYDVAAESGTSVVIRLAPQAGDDLTLVIGWEHPESGESR